MAHGRISYRDVAGTWRFADPTVFLREDRLHRLVQEEPRILGIPNVDELVTLASEFPLENGFADILAIDSDGTPTVIEVKLRSNPGQRREVVAQALAYAAHMSGTSVARFEEMVTRRPGFAGTSLAEFVRNRTGMADFDSTAFEAGLAESLKTGKVRVAIVVDEAEQALRTLVEYVDAHSDLEVVLIEVAAYELADHSLVVFPRVTAGASPSARGGAATPSSTTREQFLERAAKDNPERLTAARTWVKWADQIETQNLGTAKWSHGLSRDTARVIHPGLDAGFLTLVSTGDVWLYPDAARRLVPDVVSALDRVLPPTQRPARANMVITAPSPELIEAATAVYKAIAELANNGEPPPTQPAT